MRRTWPLPAIAAFLLAACATGASESDYLSMPSLGPGWKIARQQEQRGVQRLVEFVREGETVQSWSELVTWHTVKKGAAPVPADTLLAGQRAALREVCPDLVWNVIERREDAVLYEWRVVGCEPSPSAREKLAAGRGAFRPSPTVPLESLVADQHAVALHIESRWTRWRIEYTRKGPELPAEKREEWVRKFSEARVMTEKR